MNTPTFPPTGDFTFTDDLRGSAIIQEDLASECFVLRDENATHVVISTPVLSRYQPTLMQSTVLALHQDVRQPITFYECHAPANNTAESCVLEKLTLDENNQLCKEPVPGYVAADLIERCFTVTSNVYGAPPSDEVRSELRRMSAEGLGENVVRFRPGR